MFLPVIQWHLTYASTSHVFSLSHRALKFLTLLLKLYSSPLPSTSLASPKPDVCVRVEGPVLFSANEIAPRPAMVRKKAN